jgi:PAS domain S-box-containing protein
MEDIFAVEQKVFDDALSNIESVGSEKFAALVSDYNNLLKQLRHSTKTFDGMTARVKELNRQIEDKNSKLNMEIMMYELANRALNSGLWDMPINFNDPLNPDNVMIWSDQFRKILGYSDESDFPSVLSSCTSKLHPEDQEIFLSSFLNHIRDVSGHTTFDIECRMMVKSEEYRWFRIIGETIRDEAGKPLRVAGLLLDINEHKELAILHQKTLAAEYENKIKDEQIKTVMAMSVTTNHEINQHLTIIQLSYEILRSKQNFDSLSEKEQNYWMKIETAIAGIQHTLDKYITHSRNMKFQEYLDNVQMITFED